MGKEVNIDWKEDVKTGKYEAGKMREELASIS
jgi:hypothetical protein